MFVDGMTIWENLHKINSYAYIEEKKNQENIGNGAERQ